MLRKEKRVWIRPIIRQYGYVSIYALDSIGKLVASSDTKTLPIKSPTKGGMQGWELRRKVGERYGQARHSHSLSQVTAHLIPA